MNIAPEWSSGVDCDLEGMIVLSHNAVCRRHVLVKIARLYLKIFAHVPSQRTIGAVLIESMRAAMWAKVDEYLVVN